MGYLKRNAKRIGIDVAGYLLLLAAAATGWLPGPGGIPLALAGLGLLSINNKWANDLREYLLQNGGKVVEILFPRKAWVEWLYDFVVVILFIVCIILEIDHAAVWEISLGVFAFFAAGFIALMNRGRIQHVRGNHKR
jgi:hypothetical protein